MWSTVCWILGQAEDKIIGQAVELKGWDDWSGEDGWTGWYRTGCRASWFSGVIGFVALGSPGTWVQERSPPLPPRSAPLDLSRRRELVELGKRWTDGVTNGENWHQNDSTGKQCHISPNTHILTGYCKESFQKDQEKCWSSNCNVCVRDELNDMWMMGKQLNGLW